MQHPSSQPAPYPVALTIPPTERRYSRIGLHIGIDCREVLFMHALPQHTNLHIDRANRANTASAEYRQKRC
jgi:hypothetical protein